MLRSQTARPSLSDFSENKKKVRGNMASISELRHSRLASFCETRCPKKERNSESSRNKGRLNESVCVGPSFVSYNHEAPPRNVIEIADARG
jgi:hypothetical protein